MKRKNIVILSIASITIIFSLIAFAMLEAKSKINVTLGAVYEIVEVISGDAEKIVDFIFLDDDGNKCSLSEYTKGKYVFQNFWATWCGPCKAEIPDIIKFQEENKEQLLVIGIALERQGGNPKQQVSDYAKKSGMNYINFVGPQKVLTELISRYGGVPTIPATFIINNEGKIVNKIGFGNKDHFQKALNNAMK